MDESLIKLNVQFLENLASPFECIRSAEIIPVFEKWFTIEWRVEFNAFMQRVIPPGTRAAFLENEDTRALFEVILMLDNLCIQEEAVKPTGGQYLMVSVPFSGDGGLLDGDSHRFGACMAKGVYGQPTWSLGLAVERPFPVFAQGPQPDGFFRLVVFLVPVVPSASLGDADMGPSGGLVGDASEARRLHERFDQQGRDVIARGPVRNQLSGTRRTGCARRGWGCVSRAG